MLGEVGAQIEIVGAQAEGGTQNDFIEDRSGCVDDELAAFGGFDDAAQVAGIYLGDRNRAFLAEKPAGADGIAVAAPDGVALPLQKLCEERAGRSRSQNEDPHGVGETVPQEAAASPEGRKEAFLG